MSEPSNTPQQTDGEASAEAGGGLKPVQFVGIGVLLLALALGLGAALSRLRAEAEPVAAGPAAAGAAASPITARLQAVQALSELPKGPIERFELVYFHRTVRCAGCLKAEERVRKTLDTYYADKLQSGEIVLLVEDVQRPANPALVLKYDAFGPSLYFGVDKGGVSYTYADADIWFPADDDAKFMESLRSQIDTVLQGQ